MRNDLPPWHAIQSQAQRRIARGGFEAAAHGLREVLRPKEGRHQPPTAAILDGRVLRSTPESGHRAGRSEAERTKGSKAHLAVDTLGCLLALFVTPASVDERKAVAELARRAREETGDPVELAYVGQGYAGPKPAASAEESGIALEAVKLDGAKKGFVLLPGTLAGTHVLAFCTLMLGARGPWIQGA